jgi:NitT/TauT family transport system ATP-binding protein
MAKGALTLDPAASLADAAAAPPDIHVALRDIAHTYPARANQGPVRALGPLDFDFQRGEFVGVVGPSGCGKSTLLEIIAGLVTPSAGTVEMDGRAITGTVAEEIGVVFQEDATFAWLNVWDNVAFGLRRAGIEPAEIARRVDYALTFMGLTDFRRAYPSQLSGGMRQRVCIARTLVLRPRLVLLDEPFGALDQQTRLLMGEELLRLWRETAATVMLITHALDEAALLSDRVAVMSARPGRLIDVVATGWPRERDSALVADPAFGALTSRLWASLREESKKALGAS